MGKGGGVNRNGNFALGHLLKPTYWNFRTNKISTELETEELILRIVDNA